MKRIITVCAVALACVCASAQNWTSLFNGKNLKGWKTVAGKAAFTVTDGAIAGSRPDTVNSFLATKAAYSDFILEFEFKSDAGVNSGVQFRSHVCAESGNVYGYQYEIDGSERAWTGGIYDERREGWLYPLTFNQTARTAFKAGEWNLGRIEAIGNSIRTFVNGLPAADLLCDRDSEGFIALQIHGTRCDSLRAVEKVLWRNIRICTEEPAKYALQTQPEFQKNLICNTLSERQVSEGWKLLWDGQTSNGWRSAKAATFPEKGWTIKDGELTVNPSDGEESTNGGDIITVDKYENFWLSVDFKITPGANSGIKYFVNHEFYNNAKGSAIGCEFQILDNELHPDAKKGVNGNRCLGSLYDLIPADATKAWFRKAQWNTAWVIVRGNHVEHWLNGVKLVEYERNNQMFNALVAYSKYANWENFGNHATGNILLQDHGNEVHYRNILIKVLP